MLFNSFEFLFLFLPVTLAGYFALCRISQFCAAFWLAGMSLAFYAWWDIRYLPLLLCSIALNFWTGGRICRSPANVRKRWLVFGVTADLLLLGYFKYADFFIVSTNAALGTHYELLRVTLPIGISFFTFTQIAFLVDAWQGKVTEYRFVHYVLFVTYFPHLIAGPILHHKEMMPQFARSETYRPNWENFAYGSTLFAFGLVKKVLLADNFSSYVNPVFDSGETPRFIEAWGAALAYTFQLYFDFSAYSDMALGLAKIFGVDLPVNFNSPYKAQNIAEFWRRWHMTLSRFLRDYLYIPLGGNRRGNLARYRNLMITMLLGGLWHGAGWSFVIWGALHGIYLSINHAWSAAASCIPLLRRLIGTTVYRVTCHLACFFAVVFAWVFFRAESLERALSIIAGMIGLNGISLPSFVAAQLNAFGIAVGIGTGRFLWPNQAFWLLLGCVICFAMPNTMEILARSNGHAMRKPSWLAWRYSPLQMAALAGLTVACLLNLTEVSEFLYFQF